MNYRQTSLMWACWLVASSGISAQGQNPCVNSGPFAGHVLHFDGVDDVATVPDSAALDLSYECTIEFWFRGQSAPTYARILNKGDGQNCDSNRAFDFSYHPGESNMTASFFLGSIGTCPWVFNFTGPNVPPEQWHHIAVTLSTPNSVCLMYVDGQLVTEINQLSNGGSIPGLPIRNTNHPLLIGGIPPYSISMGGEMDELRIWSVVRSQSQIQTNMLERVPLPQPSLAAYWRFDEGAGIVANDATTAHPAAISGATWLPTQAMSDCNKNALPDSCDIAEGTSADRNENGIPDECECEADVDGSGVVNVADLLLLIQLWGPCFNFVCGYADIAPPGGNHAVNVEDLLAVINAWGACPG